MVATSAIVPPCVVIITVRVHNGAIIKALVKYCEAKQGTWWQLEWLFGPNVLSRQLALKKAKLLKNIE